MKEISSEELKTLQLEILQYVHDFCIKNNINYSLCGGTLIGAVRHKGYIPWDDDIDIMMSRPDYIKFAAIFNSTSNSNYKFVYSGNDKDHYLTFGKVYDKRTIVIETKHDRLLKNIGVNIDVFPIDGTPNDNGQRNAYWNKMFRLRSLNSMVFQRKLSTEKGIRRIIRYILFFLFKLIPANFFAKSINSFAQKNDFNSSSNVACSVFGYGRGEEISRSDWLNFVDLDFENKKFKAISGWNNYLTGLYGDYMKLPPEEKRISPHAPQAFWKGN